MHPLLLSGLDKYIRAGCHIFPFTLRLDGWSDQKGRRWFSQATAINAFEACLGRIYVVASNGVKISHLLIRPGGHTCDLVKEDKEVSRSSALSLGDKLAALLSEA